MKSSDIKTIICVACVILGVIIQFLIMPGFVSFLLGSLFIIVPPFFLAPESIEYPNIPKESFDEETKWVTVASDDIDTTFKHAGPNYTGVEFYSDFDHSICKGCLNYVILGILILLGIGMAANDQPHIGALLIDFAIVPWAYIRIKYGKKYRQAFKESGYLRGNKSNSSDIQYKRENLLTIYEQTKDLTPEMQFELTRANEKTTFSDVRINYPIQRKIPGILCSMVSVSLNNGVYSYSYYVLVFKGSKIKDASIMQQLKERASSQHFSNQVSVKDDNTILVVTKTKGHLEYETDEKDCEELCGIINELNHYIDNNKNEISELTAV